MVVPIARAQSFAVVGSGSPFDLQPPSIDWLRELNGFAWLRNLRAAAENAEMHAARHDAREAAASKDRVRAHIQERMGDTLAAIDSALGRECCPKCRGPLTEEPAHLAEPDVGIRAFAGGWACEECGTEVEAEDTDTRDDNDRRQDEDRRWGPRFFIPTFLIAFAGLLIPAAPTPIDDSLPSSGVHSPARGSDPGKDAWAGPLWTT